MFPGVRSIPSVKLYHASIIWLLVLSMWSGLSVFIPAHINVFVMSCTLNVIYIEFPFQESNLNQRQTLPCIIIIHSFSSDVDIGITILPCLLQGYKIHVHLLYILYVL